VIPEPEPISFLILASRSRSRMNTVVYSVLLHVLQICLIYRLLSFEEIKLSAFGK